MKLSKIAHTLECDLNGDGNIEIFGAAGIEDAGPNDITFLANPKYADKIKSCKAGAIILSQESPSHPNPLSPVYQSVLILRKGN